MQKSDIVQAVLALCSLILAVVSIIDTHKAEDQLKIDQTCRREFMQNLEASYVVDISVVYTEEECTKTSPFYIHHGIDRFCACDGKMRLETACGQSEIEGGCQTIMYDGNYFFNFVVIPYKSKPAYLCIQRDSVENKFIETLKDQNGSCDISTQKQCGNPSLKVPIICVGKDQECPIYQIIELEKEDKTKRADLGWGVIQLDQSYLYFDKTGQTATTLPVSQIIVGKSNTPPGTYTAAHNINLSDIEIDNSSACSSFDSFPDDWVNTNIRMSRKYFYINNIKKEQLNELLINVQFSQSFSNDKEEVSIYYRPFYKWNIEMRNEAKDLTAAIDTFDNLESKLLDSFISQIVKIFFSDIFVELIQLQTCWFEKKWVDTPAKKAIKEVLNFITIIVSLAITSLANDSAQECHNTFDDLLSQKPSTDFVQYSINIIVDFAAKSKRVFSLVCLCFSLVKVIGSNLWSLYKTYWLGESAKTHPGN